jgi:hypothetical protein
MGYLSKANETVRFKLVEKADKERVRAMNALAGSSVRDRAVSVISIATKRALSDAECMAIKHEREQRISDAGSRAPSNSGAWRNGAGRDGRLS